MSAFDPKRFSRLDWHDEDGARCNEGYRMSRTLGYAAFVVSYTVLVLLFQLLTLHVSGGEFGNWLRAASPGLAAPVALLIAQPVGRLSIRGLLFTTCTMAAAYYTLVWHSFTWSGSPGIPFLQLAQVGGWRVARDLGMLVVAPLVWYFFVRRSAAHVRGQ